MNLISARDIGQSCITTTDKIDCLIGDPKFEHNAIKALSVSEDGQFILFINEANVCIASLTSLNIIDTVMIVTMLSKCTGWHESDIVNNPLHVPSLCSGVVIEIIRK